MARWRFANVLNVAPDSRKLWQFSPSGEQFSLAREFTARNGDSIPGSLAGKDWYSLWQPKLNIAWLPAEKVFLRVLQLPAADFAETLSMVDLQMERISPLPVAQIVWTIENLPKREANLQTIVVIIVPRGLVEEFLGQLEGQGYLADRLEVPLLDQLLATEINEDGVWVYPGERPDSPCLVAWWYGGVLRNVSLLSWAQGPDAARLKEQMAQIAWSGELEGWLTSAPKWHLVATPETAAVWEPMLSQLGSEPVQVLAPVPVQQLAALSAKRAVRAESAANLLPVEYSTRYRQQFVDRLWMRGLFGVIALYMLFVIGYFAAVLVSNYQLNKVKMEVAGLSQQYTNAIQLKERVQVLDEQSRLKFAALEAWKTVSDLLPQELTLTSFNFQRGQTLNLSGKVSDQNQSVLLNYYEAVSKSTINGVPLKVGTLNTPPPRPDASGLQMIYWSFTAEIGEKRGGTR